MEIKILVKENQKKDLERFIETCKQHGFTVIHEGGGKIPNWSGWFAELKGERWQKDDTGERQLNIPDVSLSVCEHPTDKRVDYHDEAVLCIRCHCIISQFGKEINPPHKL